MELEEENKPALYKCFKVALTGPATSWYNSLPHHTIGSFDELCNKFFTHFIGSKRSSKRAIQMFNIVQQSNESIREFVKSFNREAVSAPDLTDDIRITSSSRPCF